MVRIKKLKNVNSGWVIEYVHLITPIFYRKVSHRKFEQYLLINYDA